MDLDLLPPEMLMHIFSYLSQDELFSTTSRKWKELALNPLLWKNVSINGRKQTRHQRRQILKHCRLVRSLNFSSFSNCELTPNLPIYNNLRELSFHHCCIDTDQLTNFVARFPLMEKFQYPCTVLDIQLFRQIVLHWKYLIQLKISIYTGLADGDEFLDLFTNNCQNLQKLSVGKAQIFVSDRAFCDFLKYRTTTITRLEVTFDGLGDSSYEMLSNCSKLKRLVICPSKDMTCESWTALRNLKSLEKLRIYSLEKISTVGYNDVRCLFPAGRKGVTNITSITISNCSAFTRRRSLKAIAKSCPILRTLRIMDCDIDDSSIGKIRLCGKSSSGILLSELTNSCLMYILEMPSLVRVNFASCDKIDRDSVVEMLTRKPNLEIKWNDMRIEK